MKHTFSPYRLSEQKQLVELLQRIGHALTRLLGKYFEVTIHDFSCLDNSLIFLEGTVTGRKVGAPISTSLYELLDKYGNAIEDRINYRLRVEGGRIVRSTTTFIRDKNGLLMGCFCCNYDVTELLNMRDMLNEFSKIDDMQQPFETEIKVATSTEYVDKCIEHASSSIGKQIPYFNLQDRMHLVRMLERNGIFKLKGAVNHVAYRLGVSRYTIYNYIKATQQSD